MAIGHIGNGKGILGGRRERGGTLELLIPAVLVVDGLLLLLGGRGGGNLPGPGRRNGSWRVTRPGRRTSQPVAIPESPTLSTTVVEQLASFRDIGTWLTPGLGEAGAPPGAF